MPATHGRGHLLLSFNVWERRDASAMQYLAGDWDWVCVVPAGKDRPDWIPRGATLHALSHGEVAYTWSR